MTRRRTAVVTGGGGGIGAAISRRLVADGLAVTVADIGPGLTTAEEVAQQIVAAGGTARAAECDVTDESAVERLVAEHARELGGLDVMVANAGVTVTLPLLETTTEHWQRILGVNVLGVAYCYRAAARQMIEQGRGGRLIGAASCAAHRAGKWEGAYSASKGAVRSLTQSTALELGEHGITVNVYSPGVVVTPMWESIDQVLTGRSGEQRGSAMASRVSRIPLGRLETPDDVAGLVSFLASDDAAYVTGQSFIVDGGLTYG